MKTELAALKSQDTYQIVPLPPGHKAIGLHWVYRVKLNANNTISKYKACLVAKGYFQIEGVDFNETYTPVARMTSIRIILAIATASNFTVEQIDVNLAYLNRDINAEVYMQQLLGFENHEHPNWVCKLLCSLYGIKQVSFI